MKHLILSLGLLTGLATGLTTLAHPAAAQDAAAESAGRYSAHALGVKVGDLALSGKVTSTQYAVSGKFVTSGLAAAVAGVRFEMTSTGSRQGDRLVPKRYAEDMNTGKRESRVKLVWSGGVAKASGSAIGDRGPYAVTPAQQKGAVDPLTAMFMVLRDQPAEDLCDIRQRIYDGERLTEVVLNQKSGGGDKITCKGVFRRVAGYSPEDLSERSSFPLTVNYERVGEVMQATRFTAETIYGKAQLRRR